jgi:hypothetical protein
MLCLHYSMLNQTIPGPFLEAGGSSSKHKLVKENPETVQVSDRVCEGFTRPGPDSWTCTSDRTPGDKKHSNHSITQEIQYSFPPLTPSKTRKPGSSHQIQEQPQALHGLWGVLWEGHWGYSVRAGVSSWAYGLLFMVKSLRIEVGSRGQCFPLPLRESAWPVFLQGI